jgi:hypothetical protein
MARVAHGNTTGSHKPDFAFIQHAFSQVGYVFGVPRPAADTPPFGVDLTPT